jgi:hypothetical protein
VNRKGRAWKEQKEESLKVVWSEKGRILYGQDIISSSRLEIRLMRREVGRISGAWSPIELEVKFRKEH